MDRETRIRVFIVDDNAFVREGLTALVRQQPDMTVVAEASNGAEAVTLFRQHQPSVTLMDLRMPILDGIAATQAICDTFPYACILLITTFPEQEPINHALRAGAIGYVLKDAPIEQLMEAIRSATTKTGCVASPGS